MEIFYRYEIDLEDDDGLDFGDLLEKAADNIRDNGTDLVSKYTKPQRKVPTVPNIVEPFPYPAHDLTRPTRTVQGLYKKKYLLSEFMHHEFEKVKADEMSSSEDDCVLVSDPTDDFYENLGALFADCKPVDEDVVQLHVSSVSAIEPLKHVEGIRIGRRRLNIKSKKTVQRLEPQAPKKNGIGIAEGRYPGPSGLVIRRPMQRAIKSEDHG